jgi:hypothetical protein
VFSHLTRFDNRKACVFAREEKNTERIHRRLKWITVQIHIK